MFSIFKTHPIIKLNKRYENKLEEAKLAHNNGDKKRHSQLSFEAEKIFREIQNVGIKK